VQKYRVAGSIKGFLVGFMSDLIEVPHRRYTPRYLILSRYSTRLPHRFMAMHSFAQW